MKLHFDASRLENHDRMQLSRLKLAISVKQKMVWMRSGTDWLTSNPVSVLCPLQCPTAAGIDLVRRTARLSAKEHRHPGAATADHRTAVSGPLASLHHRAPLLPGTVHQKAVHQIHLPLSQLCHLSV